MSSANRSAKSSHNCVIDANTGKIIGGSIEKIKKMDNIEMYFNQVNETFELYPSHDMQSIGGGFIGPSIGTIYVKNVKPKEIIKNFTHDDISIDESIYDTDDETASIASDKSFEVTQGSRAALQSDIASKQKQQGAPLVM